MKKIIFDNKFTDRKITIKDYCKDGAKILILYPHGLGDVLMFYPYFKKFKSLYPNCVIDIKVNELIKSMFPPVMNENDYDYVVWIPAYFNEVEKNCLMTKPECNAVLDLGIEYQKELQYTECIEASGNIVGFSFFNSFHPKEINCPYEIAKKLWKIVEDNGLIAIDLFVPKEKSASKPLNQKYDFVDWSMRTKGIGIQKMIGLMGSLAGMASVATGNFHFGMTVYPDRVLYIEKDFSYKKFTNKEILCLNVKKPDYGIVNEWINRIKKCK